MRIGLMETVPILGEKLRKELRKFSFGEKILAESVRRNATYDLILSDKEWLPRTFFCRAELFLFPGSAQIPYIPEDGILLTGGMAHTDAVSFSSIGESEAMLCIQREFSLAEKTVLPFEKKVPFDRNFSLYKNLATGFALTLAEILLTEEL